MLGLVGLHQVQRVSRGGCLRHHSFNFSLSQMRKLVSRTALTKVINREYSFHTKEQLSVIMRRASSAFYTQRNRDVASKLLILDELSKKLGEEERNLAKLISTESGKPFYYVIQEVNKLKDVIEVHRHELSKTLGRHYIPGYNNRAYLKYLPTGVVLYIPSWRYPILSTMVGVIDNLMLGNCVLLQSQPLFPSTFNKLEKMLVDSGFNAGEFQTIITDNRETEYLLEDKGITGVNFQGLRERAAQIASKAGQRLMKTSITVEGNGSFVVLADAKITEAVKAACTNILSFSGQDCYSAKQYIVVDQLYETFKVKLIESLRIIKFGNPIEIKTQLGPLAGLKENFDFYKEMAKIPPEWKVIYKHPVPSMFFPITILEMEEDWGHIDYNKLIGPVICLQRASNSKEALVMAKDSKCSLFTVIFGGENMGKEDELLDQIENTGMVFLNSLPNSSYMLPVGRRGELGFGRDGGEDGFKQFANVKLYYQK